MKRKEKQYLILILLIITVIFMLQNYHSMEINFLGWSYKASRALLLFSTLLVGILFGWISVLARKK